MSWYTIDNIDTVDSPSLVVYPQRINANIAHAVRMAGDPARLRPHVKTSKIAEVAMMLMEAGVTKFKCATIAEAEMLAIVQAPDVLLAHQPVGPKAARLLKLVQQFPHTRFSCVTDNTATATILSDLFTAANAQLDVFIDVNTGMNRSGIPADKAMALMEYCLQLPGITLTGVHGYDGHIRSSDPGERQQESDTAFSQVDRLVQAFTQKHAIPLQVVAGGSPSFPTHITRQNVQLSPGTFVFWDWGYKQQFPDEQFDYAALVVTRVLSVIDDTTVCVDLGHKAVAAENPLPRVYFLNAPGAVPLSQSEEHLVVTITDGKSWQPGDVWYGVPVHICPTVALYETATVVEDHTAKEQWRVIARTRKISV